MNTNKIKSFAKQARIQLYKGVANQLLFWGFDDKGNVTAEPEAIPGGFTFRGAVYNDVNTVPKWKKLKEKIQKSKESVKDVTEEAAYTWFNRLVAIKILEENNFIDPVLRFQEGSLVPMILQQAKAGQHAVTNTAQKANLREALLQNDDEKAFAILITQYCNTHPLLKEVFGHLDDYTEILVPNDLLSTDGFVAMLNDETNISAEDFTQVELIGWLYQFYIADRKDEVFKGFKANKKARAEDIPAATQIFTPKWIVNYMVENTVGKIYLDYEEDSELKSQMKYLVENETDGNNPLIDDITQLTLIDPACGSGHILVTGFEWLYKMYREQGYGAKQAVESILKNNLYGLDLDDRAMQLSRFAILLKSAQQLESAAIGEGKTLLGNTLAVLPHVYAFPEEHGFVSEDIAIFTNNQYVKEIYQTIDQLRQGKNIGSALKLSLPEEAIAVLKQQYQTWQQNSQAGTLDLAQQAIWAYLKDYVEVALVLTKKYAAVVANPPYMGEDGMNGELLAYCVKHFASVKYDLSSVFIKVCRALLQNDGKAGMINQSSWMTKVSYKQFRFEMIYEKEMFLNTMLYLGAGVFEELKGEVVQSVCFTFQRKVNNFFSFYKINLRKLDKEKFFLDNKSMIKISNLDRYQDLPAYQICPWISDEIIKIITENPISKFGDAKQGIKTGNNNYFIKSWFELNANKINNKWFFVDNGGLNRYWYGNNIDVLIWENEGFEIKNYKNELGKLRSRPQNISFFFREGITWSTSSSVDKVAFRYSGENKVFESSGSKFFNYSSGISIFSFLGFFNSKVLKYLLETFTNGRGVPEGAIKSLPFVFGDFEVSNHLSSNSVHISKVDWDSRETSWDFEQNPLLAQQQASLALAYQTWQEKVSQDFFQLHSNEEELNRIFIDIYGLQDELTPEVALKDITILQDELKADDLTTLEPAYRAGEVVVLPVQKEVVISQLLSYLVGCMLGRYRLDKKGLHIAHPNPTEEELANYEVAEAALPFTMQIDEDAILPLMGAACAFPDDAVKRTEDILHRIYGEESHTQNLNFIDDALGMKLDKWMTEKFWLYHISGTQYKKKPIYWLFSSNPKKPQTAAFRVLVYMHRMDGYTVQKIMRNYLHPHQEYLRNQYEVFKENEANLSKPELKTFENLQKQMIELKEYNEVLKQLADLQITFDLDDGVTVNYAKFAGAVAVI